MFRVMKLILYKINKQIYINMIEINVDSRYAIK